MEEMAFAGNFALTHEGRLQRNTSLKYAHVVLLSLITVFRKHDTASERHGYASES